MRAYTTDLGGHPRPIGHGFDIGAFELQADVAYIGPQVGGTLNYTSTTGTTTTVILPPGLVSTPTVIVFNNLVDTETTTIPTFPPGLSLSGNVFDIDAFVNNAHVKGITFTIPVTDRLSLCRGRRGWTVEWHVEVIPLRISTIWRRLVRDRRMPIRLRHSGWTLATVSWTVRIVGFSRFGQAGRVIAHKVFLPVIFKAIERRVIPRK